MDSNAYENRLQELEADYLTKKMTTAQIQEAIDELKNIFRTVGSQWARLLELLYQSNLQPSEYEKSRCFVDYVEILEYSKLLKKPYFTYLALNRRGYYYRENGDILTAFDNTWKALECLYKNRDSIEENQCLHGIRCLENNIGVTLMEEGNYWEALEYFERNLQEIDENATEDSEITIAYYVRTNCIQCYYMLGEWEKALLCARKTRSYAVNSAEPSLYICSLVWSFITEDRYGDCVRANAYLSELAEFQGDSDWFHLLPILIGYFQESGRDALAFSYIEAFTQRGQAEGNFRYMLEACLLKKKYYECQGEAQTSTSEYQKLCVRVADLLIQKEEIAARSRRESLLTYMHIAQESRKQEEFQASHEQLKHKSEYDELTGLANRYRLTEFCQCAFQRAYQESLPLFVEIIDVDYFKEVNDHYGHAQGDICLKRVAETIRQTMGEDSEQELCARLGGDEFVIVRLCRTDAELLDEMECLRKAVMDLGIPNRNSKAASVVTVSQGAVNRVPEARHDLTDFLKLADGCLYEAKKKTKNMVIMRSGSDQCW